MQAAIAKWGNSLAVRLPRHLAAQVRLHEGSTVELQVQDETLVIKPVRRRFRLADLLAQMKDEHRHEEVDWGEPRGEEVW